MPQISNLIQAEYFDILMDSSHVQSLYHSQVFWSKFLKVILLQHASDSSWDTWCHVPVLVA